MFSAMRVTSYTKYLDIEVCFIKGDILNHWVRRFGLDGLYLEE